MTTGGPTIVAIATGPARGGIGVLRLSGPGALDAARAVAALPPSPLPRHAHFVAFGALDEGLAIHFPAPHSVTGEDVVELHAHGAPRVLQLLLDAVLRVPGVRLAEPGEFTRRAFLNGRIDLAKAEAVADLVAADSEAAVRAAAAQLHGALSQRLAEVRAPLVALRADLEATLDFPDEAEGADAEVGPRLRAGLAAVRALRDHGRQGALVRRGAHVVLYGPVNAGKSTLFNRLAGADRALVDDAPGTTRDALEARLEWDGLAVTLVDTAGLRADPERLEARGIERTRRAVQSADVAVLLVPPGASEAERAGWRAEAGAQLEVFSKLDSWTIRPTGLAVSGTTGEGVDALRAKVLEVLGYRRAEAIALSSARHLDALGRAADALERAEAASRFSTLEVVAGELAVALQALADITGEDARTELLDAVFQRFCLGK